MYLMLYGDPPFYGDHDEGVKRMVSRGRFALDGPSWKAISCDATELIRSLLEKDPKERYTAKQAIDHVWLKKTALAATSKPLCEGVVADLCRFRSLHRFKRAVLHIIANQLEEPKIKALRDVFVDLDKNSAGTT